MVEETTRQKQSTDIIDQKPSYDWIKKLWYVVMLRTIFIYFQTLCLMQLLDENATTFFFNLIN